MKKYDVIGIGNPLLDFIVEVDDSFLNKLELKKGSMHLVSKEKSREILEKIKNFPLKISPGGSSANAIAGIASLGGKSLFSGKIGNDSNGVLYEQKTKEEGVLTILPKQDNEITGNAIVFITPDFERTFSVHLGASIYFNKTDISEDAIKNSKILHLEGFQLEDPKLLEAILHAVNLAKQNNLKISLDLSDSFLIKRNLSLFKDFVKNHVDIVFANESEAEAFTGEKPEQALEEISKLCEIAIIKLGENGSIIKKHDKTYRIPGFKTKVINTNGAGDMYAASFLYFLSKDFSIEEAGKIASYAASLVVGKEEARYGKELKNKIEEFLSMNKFVNVKSV